MNLTTFAKRYFHSRQKELESHNNKAIELQRNVMRKLLKKAADTEYGHQHHFDNITSYEGFANYVPVNTY